MLLNFDFLSIGVPKAIRGMNFIVDTSYPQPNEVMEEIDYSSRSTLEMNSNLVLILFCIGLIHLAIGVIVCMRKRKGVREGMEKSKSERDKPETQRGSIRKHGDKEDDSNEGEGEQVEEKKTLFKKLINCLKNKLNFNILWRIYFRLIIESFMGVLLTSINEIKTNKRENGSYLFSYIVAWIFLLSYTSFYILVIFLSILEMMRRRKVRVSINCLNKEDPELIKLNSHHPNE